MEQATGKRLCQRGTSPGLTVEEPRRKKQVTTACIRETNSPHWQIGQNVTTPPGIRVDWDQFKSFTAKATIPDLNGTELPRPTPKSSYNDDVYIEHYQSSAQSFAGKQRRGVQDEHTECLSITDHVKSALNSPFFLSLHTPLPASISSAAIFLRDSHPNAILSFWNTQLNKLDNLIASCIDTQNSWNNLIPTELIPAAGNLRSVALTLLAREQGLGCASWLQQFLYGFPLIGRLSQLNCFPRRERDYNKRAEKLSKILKSTSTRFTDRARKSGNKNAEELWNEAMEQVNKGWLNLPTPLSTEQKPFVLHNPELNIAFRFGVEQSDKLRACDDLRHSRTNLACVVETPIKLVSWDHLVEVTNLTNTATRNWAFFKADHEAAYKQLPLAPSHAKLAIIALKNPTDGRWYGFLSRTMVFGAIAAVLHYNVFSRLIAELFTRLFGIPLLNFFDDFGATTPEELVKPALDVFAKFCHKLGISLKISKSEYGRKITFLGLQGFFPCSENGYKLSVTLTEDKARNWANTIAQILKTGVISSNELEKLIGKLGFSQTNLFGKFARTQLRPLYQKFYAKQYQAQLSPLEKSTLNWWHAILLSLRPRLPRPFSRRPDLVVYTDAALLSRRIAAIIVKNSSSGPTVPLLLVANTPSYWMNKFNKKNPIIGMEMLSPLAFLWNTPELCQDKRINLYIDNDTASNTLIRGDCLDETLSAMIRQFWKLAEKLGADIWIGRVGSTVNPADLPTRRKRLPFPTQKEIQFKALFALMCNTLQHSQQCRLTKARKNLATKKLRIP